jgi:hypothetical protein
MCALHYSHFSFSSMNAARSTALFRDNTHDIFHSPFLSLPLSVSSPLATVVFQNMVVISLKKPDGEGFLFETTTDTTNDALIKSLCTVWNGRLRVRILAASIRELGKHGVMKKIDEQGLDDIKEKYEGVELEKNEWYSPDPTGLRCGNGPGPQMAATLERVAKDAEDYVDKSQVSKRVALTEVELEDKLANIRGAVMMAYPMGLPEWDTVKRAVDSVDGLEGTGVSNEIMDHETAQLWVAGKEFVKGQLVCDRLGKNEKTKVIAKLQKGGGGPPQREPAVSEEERKAMMAHYFKKQEELKRIAETNEDDYLNSGWADPKNMKRAMQGISTIRAPGI